MSIDLINDSFHDILEETRRNHPGADRDDPPKFVRPKAPRSLDIGPPVCGGGEARWGLAMSWVAAQDEMAAATYVPTGEPAVLDPEATEMIAVELGISAAASEHDLTVRWRKFVWRNHPDRQPAHARDRANVRVAIANGLYQSARRRLRQTR